MNWRRGRDSNPRYGCPYAAFRVRCFQPLSHLSKSLRTSYFKLAAEPEIARLLPFCYRMPLRRLFIAPPQGGVNALGRILLHARQHMAVEVERDADLECPSRSWRPWGGCRIASNAWRARAADHGTGRAGARDRPGTSCESVGEAARLHRLPSAWATTKVVGQADAEPQQFLGLLEAVAAQLLDEARRSATVRPRPHLAACSARRLGLLGALDDRYLGALEVDAAASAARRSRRGAGRTVTASRIGTNSVCREAAAISAAVCIMSSVFICLRSTFGGLTASAGFGRAFASALPASVPA